VLPNSNHFFPFGSIESDVSTLVARSEEVSLGVVSDGTSLKVTSNRSRLDIVSDDPRVKIKERPDEAQPGAVAGSLIGDPGDNLVDDAGNKLVSV